jgi:very-short-patch-repair endonuclease
VRTDLPTVLARFWDEQGGVVARGQVLEAGLAKDLIYSRIRSGRWQRLHPGVYAMFSGEPSREARLWAAVLHAGAGAMLSHHTAAELWKLADDVNPLIHITVPGERRVSQRPGISVHLSARASAALHPARNPPRTRVEETVIDLWESARSLDDAVGWVTRALGRRLTTQDKLREAVEARMRVRRRRQLSELLSPDAAGIHSVLEYRYVRDVERPHGLDGAKRQARSRRDGRNEYRDQLYAEYSTAVELDGRIAHPGDTRWRDIRRDNAAAASGITTLRYGWSEITTTPCLVAAEIAEVLRAQGHRRAHPCSPGCPVGALSSPTTSASARPPGELAVAKCRVPMRPSTPSRKRKARTRAR